MHAHIQVVCCTCTGAGAPALAATFRMVIIDEATQATEASTLIPLVKGAECVVLAGDPQQLPPTVITQEALRLGLDRRAPPPDTLCVHYINTCIQTDRHAYIHTALPANLRSLV